jgi:CheY-like chemotaxis protein
MRLPGLDGFEVARRVRESGLDVPVVSSGGSRTQQRESRAREPA